MYATNSHVTSQLITGAGWDRTLNWLIETGKNEEDIIYNSTSWGNFNLGSTGNVAINSGASNFDYTTGRSEYWKSNNIYDLAGNSWEWTQENIGEIGVFRSGGLAGATVTGDTPAAIRLYAKSIEVILINSFRTQLYINVD